MTAVTAGGCPVVHNLPAMASHRQPATIRPARARALGLLGAILWLASAAPAFASLESGVAAFLLGDYATAIEELTPLAEADDAEAQYYVGAMYESGLGTDQDFAEAKRWYVRAAEHGLVKAQYHLGLLYEMGEAVEKDYSEAAEWYEQAATRGHAPAQNNLGVLYLKGLGVQPDPVRAYLLFARAIDQQFPDARGNFQKASRRMSHKERAEAAEILRNERPEKYKLFKW